MYQYGHGSVATAAIRLLQRAAAKHRYRLQQDFVATSAQPLHVVHSPRILRACRRHSPWRNFGMSRAGQGLGRQTCSCLQSLLPRAMRQSAEYATAGAAEQLGDACVEAMVPHTLIENQASADLWSLLERQRSCCAAELPQQRARPQQACPAGRAGAEPRSSCAIGTSKARRRTQQVVMPQGAEGSGPSHEAASALAFQAVYAPDLWCGPRGPQER